MILNNNFAIKKRLLKPLDYVILCIALLLVVLSLVSALQNKNPGARLIVTNSNTEWVYNLKEDATFGTQGTLGVSVITIENSTAFFNSSPCDNQICVHSRPIAHNGSFIACLPNQVFVRIESDEELKTLTESNETLDIIGY